MPVQAGYNSSYRVSDLVNQKYQPLANIQIVPRDQGQYTTMLTTRCGLFENNDLLPQGLTLKTGSWRTVITAEQARRRPPLVVVSSDRVGWIKAGADAATDRLRVLSIPAFNGPGDLRVFDAGQTDSPAFYCPARIGGNRQTYVVVHDHEYAEYAHALQGTGMTVVGWKFDRSVEFGASREVTGFGASRYAAIEFCKGLRDAARNPAGQAPWEYAWLFDDNVVAIQQFPGLDPVENGMNPTWACAGFRGATRAEPVGGTRTWVNGEIAGGREDPAAGLPNPSTSGIVQQAVLWNIGLLATRRLNFSPYFLASGEDLSIGAYLDSNKIPYRRYELEIRKEQAAPGNLAGAQTLKKARNRMLQLVAQFESGGVTSEAPPPVLIESAGTGGIVVQRLSRFLESKIAGDEATRNEASTRAVEQIVLEAMKKSLIAGPALDRAFTIEPKVVNRV